MLITDGTIIDYGENSNMCINCHQPRRTGPIDDGMGMFRVTSSHWGPHHGPQATLLEGIQGSEIAGSASYPTATSATHRTESSCVNCHMSETTDGSDGLHTWIPSNNACTACHTNGVPTEVSGLAGDMTTLAALLETAGIVHDDHPSTLAFILLNKLKLLGTIYLFWKMLVMEFTILIMQKL